MPLLPFAVSTYLDRVRDSLKYGTALGARSQASIGSGLVRLAVRQPGQAGDAYSVKVTVPAGTSALSASVSGTEITVALAVADGVAVDASNKSSLVAAAINAAVPAVRADFTDDGSGALKLAEEAHFVGGMEPGDMEFSSEKSRPWYLHAQDMSLALQLLQDALTTGEMTVVSGTTTSLTDGAGTFVAGQQAGNMVVFVGNTTAALAGVEARVRSNTTTTLTFEKALPVAPAAGDKYVIKGALVQEDVTGLRSGGSYGDTKLILSALYRMIEQLGGSAASHKLTRAGLVTGAGSTEDVVVSADKSMKIDQFKGMDLLVDTTVRRIVSNDESRFVLAKPLSAPPAAGVSLAVQRTTWMAVPEFATVTQRGGSADMVVLAQLLDDARAKVEAYVPPT